MPHSLQAAVEVSQDGHLALECVHHPDAHHREEERDEILEISLILRRCGVGVMLFRGGGVVCTLALNWVKLNLYQMLLMRSRSFFFGGLGGSVRLNRNYCRCITSGLELPLPLPFPLRSDLVSGLGLGLGLGGIYFHKPTLSVLTHNTQRIVGCSITRQGLN